MFTKDELKRGIDYLKKHGLFDIFSNYTIFDDGECLDDLEINSGVYIKCTSNKGGMLYDENPIDHKYELLKLLDEQNQTCAGLAKYIITINKLAIKMSDESDAKIT